MSPRARAAWILPAITVLLHLVRVGGYGYFRDELYYLACAEHLDFGYVDHPPLVALIAALVRATLGPSLPAIRLLPALAAGATVWLAAALARELGGGRYAEALAQLAAMLAPVYLSLFSILSMNAFDLLFWSAGWWIVARILRTGDERLWPVFGIVAGVALENKISFLYLGFGLVIGLVAGRAWRSLRSPRLFAGGAIAGLLFLPHLAWQVSHGWPTLEFMRNAQAEKILALSPAAFAREQVLMAGPLSLPVWASGLAFFLFAPQARAFRPLGWACLTIFVVLLLTGGKPYYVSPVYTLLFAGGAVALEGWTDRRGAAARVLLIAMVAVGGAVAAPLSRPLLPLEGYVRYAAALGQAPSSDERHELGRLPQRYADMQGWPELAESVARAFRTLAPEERRRACVFARNYGQAGAIDLFGPALGLPKAISTHNSYFLWGPRDCSGEVVLVIGGARQELEERFAAVEKGADYACADCMPYESHKSIWIARGLKRPIAEVWPRAKSYI